MSSYSHSNSNSNSSSSSTSLTPCLKFAATVACTVLARQAFSKQRHRFVERNLGGVNEGNEDSKPVTERRNIHSASMHLASAPQLFDIAHKVDRQIVDSFSEFPSLDSAEKMALVDRSVAIVANALRKRHRVVCSGSGTSGRIG